MKPERIGVEPVEQWDRLKKFQDMAAAVAVGEPSNERLGYHSVSHIGVEIQAFPKEGGRVPAG